MKEIDNGKNGNKLFKDTFGNIGEDKFIKSKNKSCIGILLESKNEQDYNVQIECGYIPIEFLYPKEKIELFNKNEDQFLGICKDVAEAENHYCSVSKISLEISGEYLYIKAKTDLKLKFAQHISTFEKEDFEGFKPTLDRILNIMKEWQSKDAGNLQTIN